MAARPPFPEPLLDNGDRKRGQIADDARRLHAAEQLGGRPSRKRRRARPPAQARRCRQRFAMAAAPRRSPEIRWRYRAAASAPACRRSSRCRRLADIIRPQAASRGGLATTRRADIAEEFARLDVKADVFEDCLAAEIEGDIGKCDLRSRRFVGSYTLSKHMRRRS